MQIKTYYEASDNVVLDLESTKAFLSLAPEESAFDTLITGYILQSHRWLENVTGYIVGEVDVVQDVYKEQLERTLAGINIPIKFGPVSLIESVYFFQNGQWELVYTDLDGGINIILRELRPPTFMICGAEFEAVRIHYKAGSIDSKHIPEYCLHAMRMYVNYCHNKLDVNYLKLCRRTAYGY